MAVTPADKNGQEAINEINNGAEGFEVSSGQNGAPQVQNINNDEGNEKESRTSMLARHQREIRELQNKELSLKKAAAKGSKAEQKAKKKQAEEEIANLDAKMRARQAKELASLGYKSEDGQDSNGRDSLVKAIAGISVTSTSQSSKPSKGVQRRAKRAQQEAEREQRIQEEQDNTISNRVLENQQLQQKLQPLGLSLNEIKADGHCLYRAIENQLSLHPGLSCKFSYQQLREMAAAYMRSHAEDFLPFFLSESENDTKSDESLQERFEQYCREIESTAAWGGQLELGALSHSLKKHMIIISGNYPDIEMGKEYKSEKEGGLSYSPSIMLSYHKHAYGLGEHYNSVVPAQSNASS